MIHWLKKILAVSALATVAACGGGDDEPPPGTIAQVATQGGFTALVAAADKAGLVPALSAANANLTVFAPTDAAFTALATRLGFASATAMVTALDGPTLAKILQYHVLPSIKLASDLTAGTQATIYSFEGAAATLAISTTGGVKITDEVLNEATVTSANVPTSNGVIHVIDKVLVPPGVLNVVQMAQANPTFSVLVEAVVAANLVTTLSGTGPFTVFAPTDAAFTSALGELNLTKAQLLASPDLAGILTYHTVAGNVRAADVVALPKPAAVTTVQGETFSVGTTLGITDQRARSATLLATDVIASNGVIHVINNVILP
jgi:uncharacterized surface protein with fasciclin (FAS1) repeats